MSPLEHGLLGGAIVYKTNPHLYLASFAFGMLPDIPPFLYAASQVGFKNAFLDFGWNATPIHLSNSVFTVYYISHSFVTAALLFLFLFIFNQDLTILTFAYGLHIICDIPYHEGRFATRFLYPLSNLNIQGYSQFRHKWVHSINFLLISILYFLLLR